MNRFILLLVCIFSVVAVSEASRPASGVLLDSYAAIINGKVITVGDVLSALQPFQAELAAQYQGPELEQKIQEKYQVARDALIESELILTDFEMQGGNLPDRAIEDHVNTVIHDRFDNDRTAFLRALAGERLTFSEWRKQMKDQLIVQVMRQKEVTAKLLITPLDLQTAYDQQREAFSLPERVQLRTLVLDAGGTAQKQEATRVRASELRERILSGETTFEAAVSEGATLQDDGEWLDIGSLNETICAAIAPLAAGEISPPTEIGDTYYLVQLVDRQDARVRTFNEVAPEIEKDLRRAEFDRLNHIWIDSLRAKYYIQTFTHNLFD